jgi:hypothetical protein
MAPGRDLRCGRVWPSPRRTCRSFVLASLRALHLDLPLRRQQCGSGRGMPSMADGGLQEARTDVCLIKELCPGRGCVG